jgi:Tol biopolymer transport system component
VGNVVGEAIHPADLRVSPDGKRLAFVEHPIPGDDRGFVVVLDTAGGRLELTDTWGSAEGLTWSPDGEEVWFSAARVGTDSALHAVSLGGELRTLAPALGRLVINDVAPDGRALVKRIGLRHEMLIGGEGLEQERDLSWLDLTVPVDISDDGSQVLFFESGEGGGAEYTVFLRDTDGSNPIRLGHGWPHDLSPDGRFVLAVPIEDTSRLQVIPTGAGEPLELHEAFVEHFLWAGWLPDNRQIVFTAGGRDRKPRSYLKRLPDGTPRPLTPEGVGAYANSISPDGTRLAAACGKRVCLYPLDGGDPEPVPTLRSSHQIVGWGPEGRWLYVYDSRRVPVRIDRLDLVTGKRVLYKELAPADRAGVRWASGIAITPDGGSYAYSFARELCELYLVTGLR